MKEVLPAQKLLMKNRRVREMVLEPGETYPMHRHRYPYLSIMLENAPMALARLFSGDNVGKQLVKIADPPLDVDATNVRIGGPSERQDSRPAR